MYEYRFAPCIPLNKVLEISWACTQRFYPIILLDEFIFCLNGGHVPEALDAARDVEVRHVLQDQGLRHIRRLTQTAEPQTPSKVRIKG